MRRVKSKLTKKDMLIMIIKQRGGCDGISSIYCQGGCVTFQSYTRCPIDCLARARHCPLPDKEIRYEIAVNKFVKAFGQDALVEVLM